MRYTYPAIFTPEEGGYSVIFPDLEGCYTSGDDMADAIYMAEDVLAFTMHDYEVNNKEIPVHVNTAEIPLTDEQFIRNISCNTLEYI